MRYNPQRTGSDPVVTTFMDMASMTTPHGYESYNWRSIPGPKMIDKYNNVHVLVGSSPIMFACHLDTADDTPERVWFDFRKKNFIRTNGRTLLGADDKAGAAIMCHMITKRVPGHYVFHAGEEVGCIGSTKLSEHLAWDGFSGALQNGAPLPDKPKAVISFDRRGYDSIVTHQMGSRTCSDAFALDLADALDLDHQPDPTGVWTDSVQYAPYVPECTNVSVGYFNQHSNQEEQDIDFLRLLAERCCKVDWESLTISRDPSAFDQDDPYGYASWFGGKPDTDQYIIDDTEKTDDLSDDAFDALSCAPDKDHAMMIMTEEGYSEKMANQLIEWHGFNFPKTKEAQ